MTRLNFQLIIMMSLSYLIMAKEPTTIITLKIQETPLLDKELKMKTLKELNETRTSDTYYYENNKSNKNSSLIEYSGNSFFDAFYAAYILHGDVMISANDIWLVVNHKFGEEINKNPEDFRELFVTHKGKKQLEIILNTTSQNWANFPSQENRWDIAMEMFHEEIGKNTKGDISLLMKNDFSSTTMVEQAAANICLMSSMKEYFEYIMILPVCGIQNVHFVGGVEDFEYLVTKIEKLIQQYPLSDEFKQQLEKINDIVNIFVDQMKDSTKVDVDFWNKIFDEDFIVIDRGCASRTIPAFSGWMSNFFGTGFLKKAQIPSFSSSAPVLAIDYYQGGKTFDLLFITDMKGVEEVKPNVFRPITNIYVTENKEKKESPSDSLIKKNGFDEESFSTEETLSEENSQSEKENFFEEQEQIPSYLQDF